MKRPKPINLSNSNGKALVLIGHPRSKNDGAPYINLHDASGNVIGMLEDKDLRRLRRWIGHCLEAK